MNCMTFHVTRHLNETQISICLELIFLTGFFLNISLEARFQRVLKHLELNNFGVLVEIKTQMIKSQLIILINISSLLTIPELLVLGVSF